MKNKVYFIVLFIVICCSVFPYEYNVLSYFASDNSLDGQPMIDKVNMLRFFPVYSVQDSVTSVEISLYFADNELYFKNADKMKNGDYWEALLPEFHLGEAIQRIEVKMEFNVDERITEALNINSKNLKDYNPILNKNFVNIMNDYNVKLDTCDVDLPGIGELAAKINKNGDTSALVQYLKKEKSDAKDKHDKIINLVLSYKGEIKNYLAAKEQLKNIEKENNEIRDSQFKKVTGYYTNTEFSGPTIQKSDFKIEDDFKTASLLYRYYNTETRHRMALDPAEKLGIFRVRYIPFPITMLPDSSSVELIQPMSGNNPTVFEIGMNFGDRVVAGEGTLKPDFALNRFGIAMAITEKLFTKDAQIIALVLTYDFNSYASIGYGQNLAQGKNSHYLSLGINKKAFEALLNGVGNIFD